MPENEVVSLPLPTESQLDVQAFGRYALIIDARTPHEYAEDHIPGAMNLPVADDAEFAEVGTLHATDPHAAYLVGARYALNNIARHVQDVISNFRPTDRLLVYCFRGGKRSRAWAEPLRGIGFKIDVLPGGWKNYRRWVREGLEQLPTRFEFRVLAGPTGCGKTRLLQALQQAGAQVLDLEGLARHRGSLIGALPDEPQPSQKWFDSQLFDVMRRFDAAQPIWVEAESKKIGNLQLPQALHDAMHAATPLLVSAPMGERVRLCRDEYQHFVREPLRMIALLEPLKPLVGGQELTLWRELAQAGRIDELFERLVDNHYDPCYARSHRAHYGERAEELHLPSLEPAALDAVAQALLRPGR
ncbi:tRNA 2-selenouridine(34) synthase MnmH [Schlegelella sp. S2-27]|uniref:tRNA 2-selenouridine(34) synthase MnmH n=1 Tax=Caldimonas mangrovi TaxID=2944811 RepID=A0ABT0YPN6_9BURK|nr:tRNA 2-selenouridine(34) synthase MnmH [Caldimonas mangrovi]MCM5680207.1 tRNA 2-selenouridine(34) synthase MnmH [Caldimonas mangrovi]